MTSKKIYLFKSIEGNSARSSSGVPGIRFDGPQSGGPGRGSDAEIDRAAVWRCCRGGGALHLPLHGSSPAGPGGHPRATPHDRRRVRSHHPDGAAAPHHALEYAEIAYELLLDAVRLYAGSGRVGVLLSGGIDSSSVLTALVDAGADVIAYHLNTDDQLADESAYARAVCEHLNVPLVSILTDNGATIFPGVGISRTPTATQGTATSSKLPNASPMTV